MKNHKTRPERGDIYWIGKSEYRQSGDYTMQAERPAIIVSSREAHGHGYTYEVVFLTTNPRFDAPTHCTIRSSKKVSTALCDQITTVSREQIGMHYGTCTPDEMATIEMCMMISLGLDDRCYQDDREDPYEMIACEEIDECVVPDPEEQIYALKEELIRERTEAETMRSLYNDLLEKSLSR